MADDEINVKVAVRCRPLSKLEKELASKVIVSVTGQTISLQDPNPYAATQIHNFTYDFSYGIDALQNNVYKDLGVFILDKALQGYNGTIFAYGQTGSGKTHSIMGYDTDPGIIPRLNEDLFERVDNAPDDRDYLVTVSYLELYNETIFDLLNIAKDSKDKEGLKVREHPKLGVYVEGLTELVVTSSNEINKRMVEGNSVRHVASTKMNDRSSRSHSVFTIKIEQKVKGAVEDESSNLTAKINLVDLAGSERVAKTEAEGNTLKEATMINKSLSALGNVINALADPKKRKAFVPFRESKLTRLLQESLGGNTVTIMIAAIGPADRNFEETLNTLQYANRAKNIQNKSKKNETNPAKIVAELREQIESLKAQLAKSGGTADPEQVKMLQDTIGSLEYAKRQTWEEKVNMSKKYNETRWVSLAKNGMLQLKMNLMRKQKQKLEDRVKALESEKEALKLEFDEQTQLLLLLQQQYDIIDKELKEERSAKAEVKEKRAQERWKLAVKTVKAAESNNQINDLKEQINNQTTQLNQVIMEARSQSEISQNLEEKIRYKDQETELLYEEIAALKRDNDLLKNETNSKQADMDALVNDVTQMLQAEGNKISFMEQEIQRLQIENDRLKKDFQTRPNAGALSPGPTPIVTRRSSGTPLPPPPLGGPSSALSINTISDYLCHSLKDDPQAHSLEGNNVVDAISDGVLLCKLINTATPGTIDERVLNMAPTTPEEVMENLTLCLSSAKSIGCKINDLTVEDIITGEETKIVNLISEIYRITELNQVSVKNYPALLNLRKSDEETADYLKLNSEQLLMRWFNFHLKNATASQPQVLSVSNFSDDLKDSHRYFLLLNQLSPLCDLSGMRESDLLMRAELLLKNAEQIRCRKYISPQDVVTGHIEKNLMFTANLFRNFHHIPEPLANSPSASSSTLQVPPSLRRNESLEELIDTDYDEKREERAVRGWINSLNVDSKHVNHLGEDVKDGIIILKVLDKVAAGSVQWKKVNTNPSGIYKKIENCNYAIEVGKDLKFSLVNIQGKDLVDGNIKFTLAFLQQAMQHHYLSKLKHMAFGGKEQVTEDNMITWCNEKVKAAGKSSKVRSFKDPSLKDSIFLIDLMFAIRPNSVNYSLVTPGSTDDERMQNAKYVISVARKIGCNIFMTWEDIVEAKHKRILCLVGELMTVTH